MTANSSQLFITHCDSAWYFVGYSRVQHGTLATIHFDPSRMAIDSRVATSLHVNTRCFKPRIRAERIRSLKEVCDLNDCP